MEDSIGNNVTRWSSVRSTCHQHYARLMSEEGEGSALIFVMALCFAEERTWERAEGTPEPWERGVFFEVEQD